MRIKSALSVLLAALLSLTILPAAAYDSAGLNFLQTMSGGAAESFLIDDNGTLWAWGDNQWGQLGDGTTEDRATPVRVLEGVRSVSAGECHTYAVLEDDTLWAWGRNVSNSFPGSDELVNSLTPIKIMDDVASASTGVCTHLAVKTDGSLWVWGKYIGNRTNKQVSTPQKILDNVAAACTGFGHSLALKQDGTLWAWGQNNNGEVGDGSGRERLTPVQVLDNVAGMSAGYGFSAAVKTDGTLWTWGRNWQGELGDGTTWLWGPNWEWHSSDPEEDAELQETLAAWIERWGAESVRDRSVPSQVLTDVSAVCASNNNTYALRTDGTLWAWGNNHSGDIGDGTTEDRLSPVLVLDHVTQVSVGWDHVLARRTDNTLWTWGSNVTGQLGNGESLFYSHSGFIPRFSAHPIQVMAGLDGHAAPSLSAGSSPAPWAQAAVDEAIASDFLPVPLRTRYNQTITRAEFCALAVRFYESFTGQEITSSSHISFTDTQDPDVEKAASLGIVTGVGEGRFSPESPLNRAQAAVILTNLARIMDFPLPQATPDFSDAGEAGSWALNAIGCVQGTGIMSGVGGGRFAPQDTYTREQSVVTIMNLYQHISRQLTPEEP